VHGNETLSLCDVSLLAHERPNAPDLGISPIFVHTLGPETVSLNCGFIGSATAAAVRAKPQKILVSPDYYNNDNSH
jgi:hypothetical protein